MDRFSLICYCLSFAFFVAGAAYNPQAIRACCIGLAFYVLPMIWVGAN